MEKSKLIVFAKKFTNKKTLDKKKTEGLEPSVFLY